MQSNYEIVRIPLSQGRGYEIEIGAGNLAHVGPLLASSGSVSHCEILTDENIAGIHAERVAELINDNGIDVSLRVVPAGEQSKSVATLEAVWDAMYEDHVDRKTVMIAVGGGVVGDLAGFAAASYARGIRFLQIPTTLLAQVDSSVGGKVAVNLDKAKNMVGAFHQPIAVLIDTETLTTLNDMQYRSGLGEVVKYAESLDMDFFAVLEQNAQKILDREPVFLRKMIARCCQIKAEIVLQDEKETTGLRAKLNFGHTFGHAFESLYGIGTLPHGLAVSVGCVYAAKLAAKLGRVPNETVERMVRLHKALELPTELAELSAFLPKTEEQDEESDLELPTGLFELSKSVQKIDENQRIPENDGPMEERILDAMLHDKKTEHGQLRFVLPNQLGECELVDGVEPDTVRELF